MCITSLSVCKDDHTENQPLLLYFQLLWTKASVFHSYFKLSEKCFRSDLFFKYDRNNCCIIEKTVAPGDVILTMKT